MIVPFSMPSAPMPLPLRPRRRKTPGSPVSFDPECCYLHVDGSYELAVGDSPEKCGWGLHVVGANAVLGQFLSLHCLRLATKNTHIFKLSNYLAKLCTLVHAFEFLSYLRLLISTS